MTPSYGKYSDFYNNKDIGIEDIITKLILKTAPHLVRCDICINNECQCDFPHDTSTGCEGGFRFGFTPYHISYEKCPICGNFLEYRNIGENNHWYYCSECKVKWNIKKENAFQNRIDENISWNWLNENEIIWEENAEYLKDFREIKFPPIESIDFEKLLIDSIHCEQCGFFDTCSPKLKSKCRQWNYVYRRERR